MYIPNLTIISTSPIIYHAHNLVFKLARLHSICIQNAYACMEIEEFGSGDREEEDEEDEDEDKEDEDEEEQDEVFQKMKQLTNIRRDGEKLVITTAG